jgi:hypothetical protein
LASTVRAGEVQLRHEVGGLLGTAHPFEPLPPTLLHHAVALDLPLQVLAPLVGLVDPRPRPAKGLLGLPKLVVQLLQLRLQGGELRLQIHHDLVLPLQLQQCFEISVHSGSSVS